MRMYSSTFVHKVIDRTHEGEALDIRHRSLAPRGEHRIHRRAPRPAARTAVAGLDADLAVDVPADRVHEPLPRAPRADLHDPPRARPERGYGWHARSRQAGAVVPTGGPQSRRDERHLPPGC